MGKIHTPTIQILYLKWYLKVVSGSPGKLSAGFSGTDTMISGNVSIRSGMASLME
jgi:hypothetical protein